MPSSHTPRFESLPPWKAYRLLESGPVVLVTTAQNGRFNVMTMGFHMVVRHDPPLLGAVIGPWDHSQAALKATRECVLAIPTMDLAETVVAIGNSSGRDTDKFAAHGLTAMPSERVAAPRIAECLANIECRVADDSLADAYDLFLLEPVAIGIDRTRRERRTLHHNGDGTFTADGEVLDLREKMVRWKQFQD